MVLCGWGTVGVFFNKNKKSLDIKTSDFNIYNATILIIGAECGNRTHTLFLAKDFESSPSTSSSNSA